MNKETIWDAIEWVALCVGVVLIVLIMAWCDVKQNTTTPECGPNAYPERQENNQWNCEYIK